MDYCGICLSPMISFCTSNDIKYYLGCDLDVGAGFLFYGSFGIGKEYFNINNRFFIEPILLINLDTFYASVSGNNRLYGLQLLTRFIFS